MRGGAPMPVRPLTRDQVWLLPPSLDDMVPDDHPVRFVAAFVEALCRSDWHEVGIALEGDALGAPAYDARVLLSVWLYGFMTGVRSCRKLEVACREQVPYLWLTGRQEPDHNTLWRFYQEHRQGLRKLLRRTVRTAVRAGLVDWAVQAVDGTKIAGNAARGRTYDAAGLRRLLERTEAAIAELEAQNATGGEAAVPRLPQGLAQAQVLRTRVQEALADVTAEEGPRWVNLTDGEARLMKSRQGIVPGYNAQAMVSRLDPTVARRTGLLITAAEVTTAPDDHEQLVPLLEAAEANSEQEAGVTVADGGYHSGANLVACAERGQTVLMPETQERALQQPYHKDHFLYDAATDTYTCPAGQPLCFVGWKERTERLAVRVYRAAAAGCRRCAAFGRCTKDGRQGRALEVGPHEAELRAHREVMRSEAAQALCRQRKVLAEPSFGILKEQQGARRFLLRGLANVRAEWALLASAFNLRTLARVWQGWAPGVRWQLTGVGSS